MEQHSEWRPLKPLVLRLLDTVAVGYRYSKFRLGWTERTIGVLSMASHFRKLLHGGCLRLFAAESRELWNQGWSGI
jgi:hypothetical protein